MGWIPTIKVVNEDGRNIRINVSEELEYATKGYRRVVEEESKDENLKTSNDLDKEKADGDKIIADDDQSEVIPSEASVSEQSTPENKEAKEAAEIATE